MYRAVNSLLVKGAKVEWVQLGDARITTSNSFYEGHLGDPGQRITLYLLERFQTPDTSQGRKRNVRPALGGKSPPICLFRQVFQIVDSIRPTTILPNPNTFIAGAPI
jgi:hypothetical protein